MKIIVYVGPTISDQDVHSLLPDAILQPPVSRGDILNALPKKPDALLIVDGYFYQTSSVWHKEIMFAIEQGVTVVGAASMGALRASELAQFGMIGVGKIYEKYISGDLDGDDEVAMLHAPHTLKYKAQTDALVNVRETLDFILKNKIITLKFYTCLLSRLKAKPFFERDLKKEIQMEDYSESYLDDLKNIREWCCVNELINQKRIDAIEACKYVRNLSLKENPPAKKLNVTYLFMRQYRNQTSRYIGDILKNKYKTFNQNFICDLASILYLKKLLKMNGSLICIQDESSERIARFKTIVSLLINTDQSVTNTFMIQDIVEICLSIDNLLSKNKISLIDDTLKRVEKKLNNLSVELYENRNIPKYEIVNLYFLMTTYIDSMNLHSIAISPHLISHGQLLAETEKRLKEMTQ